MKFKKTIASIVAGAAMFTFAGTSMAAITSDINIYGASAQFIMWRDKAANFMTDNTNNCSDVQSAQLYVNGQPDKKNAITKGTCDGVTRYIRVASKASYAGVLALQGNTAHPNYPTGCSTPGYVKMIDETTCNWTTGRCEAATKCVPVTVGASDTDVKCFSQASSGNLLGPLGGAWTTRDFAASPISWTGADACKPLVVPFAFFVNNGVKKSDGTTTISNITRDQAELIFSGYVVDWSGLVDENGNAYKAQTLVSCLRHGGSGTQASLDAYLTTQLGTGQSVGGPDMYFNDGSGDMMNCINGVSGSTVWSPAMAAGAIGYADADQVVGTIASYPNTVRVNLNGVTPGYNTIANGSYNFYGMQHLYGVEAGSGLCNYAGNGEKMADHPLWVPSCAMVYERTDTCESFPLQYKGNTCQ